MIREEIEKSQPVAYQILKNSLTTGKSAHAYLFVGEKGTPKMETAILLAQSLLCDQDGFACEVCETCQRIKNGTYTDCICVDGENKSIKKEAILHIQEEFTKTALEQKGKKVYILNRAENATTEALNSLLKFLEEPSNDVTAILIVEQADRLLPTIVSRCQMIPFKKNKLSDSIKRAKEQGLEALDAYLCAKCTGNLNDIQAMFEDENYQAARYLTLLTIEKFKDDPYQVIFEVQREGFKEKKGNDRIQFSMYADMLSIFFKDCIQKDSICSSEHWKKAMNQYDITESTSLLSVCMKSKDKCTKSANIRLLADQMLIEMKEAIK